jgi:hypothetical protein
MKLSTTKGSSLLSAPTQPQPCPKSPMAGSASYTHSLVPRPQPQPCPKGPLVGLASYTHRLPHSQADACASAWLCHKGPIARLVSHIRMLQYYRTTTQAIHTSPKTPLKTDTSTILALHDRACMPGGRTCISGIAGIDLQLRLGLCQTAALVPPPAVGEWTVLPTVPRPAPNLGRSALVACYAHSSMRVISDR